MRRKSGSSVPPHGTSVYEVQANDSLAGIAAHFGTTTSVVRSLNRLMSDLVYPGQIIYVPEASDLSSSELDERLPGKVPTSSSCSMITSKSDTSLTEAQRLNHTHSNSLEGFVAPRPLSSEQVKLISEKCDQRFIKIHVRRILDDREDAIKGVMLVTPDFVMFDPDECSQSNVTSEHSMSAPMASVLSVSVYHDDSLCRAMSVDADDKSPTCGHDPLPVTTPDHNVSDGIPEIPVDTGPAPAAAAADNNDRKDEVFDSVEPETVELVGHSPTNDSAPLLESYAADGEIRQRRDEDDRIIIDDDTDDVIGLVNAATWTVVRPTKKSVSPVHMCLCITVEPSLALSSSPSSGSPPVLHNASSSSHDQSFWYFVPYDSLRAARREVHHFLEFASLAAITLGEPNGFRYSSTSSNSSYLVSVQAILITGPVAKVVDELYAFFIQWSRNVDADENGFVVVDNELSSLSAAAASGSEAMEPFLLRTVSINKDWEIINVRELRRRVSEAELENLPLPELSETSDILDQTHLRTLMGHLPARAEGSSWRLIYSASHHGYSLRTFYRQMTGIDSPVLIIIKDIQHHVFGTMQLTAIKRSDLFYGTGESYLFTFYPEFQKFGWTGLNNYFIKADDDGLCFGAGRGCYGLWLDEGLYHGTTRPCSTYDNKLLTTSEDFTIAFLEVWGFDFN